MLYKTHELILVLILLTGIVLFYFVALYIFQRRKKKNPDYAHGGLGPMEGALLGLISLLLSFTFNKSASNYDQRRKLVVEETNDISTVLLRSDLYPDSLRAEFRANLKDYIMTRIDYYEAEDDESISLVLQRAETLSQKIWMRASQAAKQPGDVKSMQMIPAVNSMMDIVSRREEARQAHTPDIIIALLFILIWAGSFIVGFAAKSKKADWIILCIYSLMTVITTYVILDLDRPRKGMINTHTIHQSMTHLIEMASERK